MKIASPEFKASQKLILQKTAAAVNVDLTSFLLLVLVFHYPRSLFPLSLRHGFDLHIDTVAAAVIPIKRRR
jgi:hypothetical protein